MADDTHLRGVGCYRSKDPLENFKIRVKLQRVQVVPLVTVPQFGEDGAEMQPLPSSDAQTDSHEYTFSWQEKVFSQKEIEFYSNKGNCQSHLHHKYHEKVTNISNNGNSYNRLFSYTNPEAMMNFSELKSATTSPNEETNFLIERIHEMRKRSNFCKPASQRMGMVLPSMNIVDDKPSKDTKKNSRIVNTSMQSMFIMADLKPRGSNSESNDDEYILCEVTANSNNMLSVLPDFNSDLSKPYVIEYSRHGVKETYHFTLAHASKDISDTEKLQEAKLYGELCSRHSEFISSCVSSTFDMPPTGILKVCLNGEIVSAKNFEYDNLYVHYFLELNEEWIVPSHCEISNVTQISKTTTVGENEVAHFCYPFSIEIQYKINQLDENNSEKLPKWPVLYLEVLSLDSWGRYRTEGYGHMVIPSMPGCYCEEVKTWRPLTHSSIGEMRRFFIGGSPRLENLTYAAIPSSFEGKQLSKLGFRTIASGSVKVRMNILHQSQAYLASENQKKKMGSLIERLGAATIHSGVAAVLVAFQRARQRMIAARERIAKT